MSNLKDDNLFMDFAMDYDRMIKWEERLKREEPFFRKIFSDAKAQRVLDTACGTGRHALMFCSWGLDVAAADISPDMIALAKENGVRDGCNVKFKVAGIEEIDTIFKPEFDVITCMGNSLPHIKNTKGLGRIFSGAYKLLKPQGLLVMQIRNYDRVYAKNERFMPLNSRSDQGKEYLYLRMNDIGEEYITFNIIAITKDQEGKWSYRVESEELKPWRVNDLATGLDKAGLKISGICGDMSFGPYKSTESTDLIIIARKDKQGV